ncbi:hypothetical protein N7U66_03715 [Lacinutrix neustonica]|uniref:Uncharacterized protein n=1 Tax=Lacinutrix neustonica TaxID=2980107 RepID=A0A9E8SHK2_9FLAO|nr:hypothetical protein [Lacinutrix neustonica]WAC02780.1 hypothetical protein N7U66_03715 [Lacinutrix neustonica]
METIKQWLSENPTFYSVIKYLFIVALILLGIQFIRKFLKHNIENTVVRYKSQKGIEIIGYVVLIMLSFFISRGLLKTLHLPLDYLPRELLLRYKN